MSAFRAVYVDELVVSNPIFAIGDNAVETGGADDTRDLGYYGEYWDGAQSVYTGLFRDATDKYYKLYDSLEVIPTVSTGFVDTAGAGFAYADLRVRNLNSTADLLVGGDATVTGNFTVSGTTTTVNTETLLVEDNIIVANAGPGNIKEDGGFVVSRLKANVITDTPKETGTASSGTSTTVFELASGSVGEGVTDYYKGWIVEVSGVGAGSAVILSSTNATPAEVTLVTALTGTPDNTSTYELFNKKYVGSIWDESIDVLSLYGFPREDTINILDPTATDGSAPEYINFQARDITARNNLTAIAAVIAGTTVTAGTGVTATTGNITASSGNVSASGSVTGNTVASTTSMTVGTTLSVTGNTTLSGNLSVAGVVSGPLKIDDNILAVNTGPSLLKEDGGFVSQRSVANVILDTPKETGTATSGTSTTVFELASGSAGEGVTDYYKGWIVEVTGVGAGTAVILSSTNATPTEVTLETALTGTPDNTSTYELFNKRFVGPIWDESLDKWALYGFPREDAENKVELTSATGNVADLLDLNVNNLNVSGTLTSSSSSAKLTFTQALTTTFTDVQIKGYDIIYLNPTAGNTTYTLPSIASLSLTAGTDVNVTFVNIHPTNRATIAPNGANTIEGLSSLLLRNQWVKSTLMFGQGLTTVLIE